MLTLKSSRWEVFRVAACIGGFGDGGRQSVAAARRVCVFFTSRSLLYAWRSTLHAPHSTLYTLPSTLYTLLHCRRRLRSVVRSAHWNWGTVAESSHLTLGTWLPVCRHEADQWVPSPPHPLIPHPLIPHPSARMAIFLQRFTTSPHLCVRSDILDTFRVCQLLDITMYVYVYEKKYIYIYI